jgi:hypothetical protein
MKSKITIVAVVAIALGYVGYAFYEIKGAHPYKLVYAYVYGNWDYFDSRLPPLPFRDKIVRHELEARPLAEYDEWPSFELLPYTILAMKDADKFDADEHRKRMESLVDMFLQRGLSVDKQSSTGCTSLQLAVIDRDLAAIEFLRARNASLLENRDGEGICQRSVASLMERYIE